MSGESENCKCARYDYFLIKGVILADVYTKFLSSLLSAKKIRPPPPPNPVLPGTILKSGRTHNLQKSSPAMPPLLHQAQIVFDSSLHQLVPLGLFIIN